MKLPNNFRVCVSCSVPHVENCNTCFGWGLSKGYPITAGKLETVAEFTPCPECGGTPTNEDIFTLWGDPREEKPIGVIEA